MAQVKARGFVVRVVPVGESDRIINVLTEKLGLITVSVRGARRTRSPYLLTTQAFSYSSFELFYNKNRYYLNASELIEPFYALHQDLDRLVCASHLAEILVDSLRDDLPQEDVYRLWAYSLQAISTDPDPLLVVYTAQLRLLMLIGFGPRLDRCVYCSGPAEKNVSFSIRACGIVCSRPACLSRATDARKIPGGLLTCLRHIEQAPLSRLFQFSLDSKVREMFFELSAQYLSHQMEKAYTRLNMIRDLNGNNWISQRKQNQPDAQNSEMASDTSEAEETDRTSHSDGNSER